MSRHDRHRDVDPSTGAQRRYLRRRPDGALWLTWGDDADHDDFAVNLDEMLARHGLRVVPSLSTAPADPTPTPEYLTARLDIPGGHPMAAALRDRFEKKARVPLTLIQDYFDATAADNHPLTDPGNSRRLLAARDALASYMVEEGYWPGEDGDVEDGDMPWTDAARDFGDAPLDDDTGQPSQPPATLAYWAVVVTARSVMSDGSPGDVVTAYGTGMVPWRVAATVIAETDWPDPMTANRDEARDG